MKPRNVVRWGLRIGIACFALLNPCNLLAVDILVNQTGFEPNSPKIIRAQRTTDFAGDGTFSVKKVSDNSTVFTGPLTRKGGLWNRFYWEGDFSSLRTLGDFYVAGTVSAETANSYNFNISPSILRNVSGILTYRWFLTQRCGSSVTDPYDGTFWHGNCHMDDGVRSGPYLHMDAVGGWHDAGDYNKFPHVFGGNGVFALCWLYDNNRSYYDAFDLNNNSIPDILDEALYQARWLAKMVDTNGHCLQQTRRNKSFGSSFVAPEVDTNNSICNCNSLATCDACDDRWIDAGTENTPQETVVCASLIKMHRILASKGLPTENFAAKALSIWDHRVALAISEGGHNNLGEGAHHIFAGLDLFAVFGQQNCWDRTIQRVEEMSNGFINNPATFDTMNAVEGPGYELGALAWFARNYPNAPQTPNAILGVQALMNHYISYLVDGNPVGLIRRDDAGTLQYFPTNPDNDGFFLGINRLYLLVTWGAIQAHKLLNDPAYLKFAIDQYNWVMGSNYFRICMMHGAGDNHPSIYHHRYTSPPGWPRHSQPGVVPNGIVRTYSTGLPQFDTSTTNDQGRYQTNEAWLINNAAYAMALSEMTVFQDDAQVVSDTIPDTMYTGQTYNVSVTMKNNSYVPWDSTNYRLGAVDDSDPLAATRHNVVGTIDPGQQYTFNFTMTAPGGTGPLTTDWRMVQEGVNWFGQTLTKQVQVLTSAPPAPVTNFVATTPATRQITLSWTNPSSTNFTSTMIRWSTTAYPTSPTDGNLLIDKSNTPGSNDSTTHTNLTAGLRYYYSAFAHNPVPAYASGVTASAIATFQSDFNNDGDVDISDYSHLQVCFTGTIQVVGPGCEDADLNADTHVDTADFTLFLNCLNGANLPPGLTCAN